MAATANTLFWLYEAGYEGLLSLLFDELPAAATNKWLAVAAMSNMEDMEDFIDAFEHNYEVKLSKDGIKKIHKLFSEFDPTIIEDALMALVDQYDDPTEAMDKIGGICYNKNISYFEE